MGDGGRPLALSLAPSNDKWRPQDCACDIQLAHPLDETLLSIHKSFGLFLASAHVEFPLAHSLFPPHSLCQVQGSASASLPVNRARTKTRRVYPNPSSVGRLISQLQTVIFSPSAFIIRRHDTLPMRKFVGKHSVTTQQRKVNWISPISLCASH